MIVRTAPAVLPAPDAMRAMERLEAQLRRAADDLALTLAEMRAAADAPLVDLPEPERTDRCMRWMPRAQTMCGRSAGHGDTCRSRAAMDADRARQERSRA